MSEGSAATTVDRLSLCQALASECERQDRRQRLFIQVNIGAEEQKSGVLPQETEGSAVLGART